MQENHLKKIVISVHRYENCRGTYEMQFKADWIYSEREDLVHAAAVAFIDLILLAPRQASFLSYAVRSFHYPIMQSRVCCEDEGAVHFRETLALKVDTPGAAGQPSPPAVCPSYLTSLSVPATAKRSVRLVLNIAKPQSRP